MPVAGKAARFIDAGWMLPKPLIMIKERNMLDWSMSSLNYDNCHLIFAVRKDHIQSHSIDKIIKNRYGADTSIVVVDKITRGTASTCLLAKDLINNQSPLVIYTPDVYFEPKFNIQDAVKSDGFLLTFKANSPAHSYVLEDDSGKVVNVAEKEVISNHANVGLYGFKHGSMFVQYAEEMIAREMTTNNEFYVAPIYNLVIRDGLSVHRSGIEKMHVLGTPEDLKFFISRTLKRFGERAVSLCADHSGFALKEIAKDCLHNLGIPYIDCGTYTQSDCDHFDFLFQVAHNIRDGISDFGMAFCRTGQGFNLAANKIKNIRSALIWDEYTAEHSIAHNCANFFCVPSAYVTNKTLFAAMIWKLMNTTFSGGRHMNRIQKLDKLVDLYE